jgi:hypothetical protein
VQIDAGAASEIGDYQGFVFGPPADVPQRLVRKKRPSPPVPPSD